MQPFRIERELNSKHTQYSNKSYDDVIDKVTGHLYLVTDSDGARRRLSKRDVSGISGSQKVKLDLGSSYGAIDMALSSHNVWTADSQVYQRFGAGREAVEADDIHIDRDCFIRGHLLSQSGVASFSLCNGLTGFVQTPEVEYIVEQTKQTDNQLQADWEFPEVTVTMLRPSTSEFEESLELPGVSGAQRGFSENSDEEDENSSDTENESESTEDEDVDQLMKEEELFFNQSLSVNETTGDRENLITKRGKG
ncbi:hypothetical protein ElyMa_002969100 [Elysia marginata]|uniref:Peptidase M12B propeptide domain-containing protein n=1 Tax=Elysia marginata TaxID=1093978 RepID=A0AAV4IC49_9GAST|nr:hypothetical protein ElyMa_002969100 [Elysia marginata]